MDAASDKDEELKALREAIAEANNCILYRQYNEAKAAEIAGMHPQTLKSARLGGRIGFIRKGKRAIAYFGFHIVDFLIESMECPSSPQTNPISKSVSTGSVSARTRRTTTGSGGTPTLDGSDALRLAQQTLKKPSSD